MVGSRLETVGSIFSRTRDLIRAGVLKEKPLWFDIYEAFPPLRDPVFRRPALRYGKAKAQVAEIFYQEDQIRAPLLWSYWGSKRRFRNQNKYARPLKHLSWKFYSTYGSSHKALDMFNPNFKSSCQRFVEKYTELQKHGETDEEKLFVETGKALLAEGVILRRVGEARLQQRVGHVSQKNEQSSATLQTILETNQQPLTEVPQKQQQQTLGQESEGSSGP